MSPIPMLLFCPKCHVQHIDTPDPRVQSWVDQTGEHQDSYPLDDGAWTNPPHRSHLCHACGCIWRPSDRPTEGVKSIATTVKSILGTLDAPIGYASIEDMVTWAQSVMSSRPCDFPIGGRESPYLERWWIVPRNEMSNVYLHKTHRDDDDRALHDHPWANTSVIVAGSYYEHLSDGTRLLRSPGDVIERTAETAHRLELVGGEPCVSLFFTGPKIREWGFHCPNGWVHWRDFTTGENGELVGKGCGE